MNWKNVKLVFLREVRDQIRDRRTLFMVVVLPLLLYPALGLGMLEGTLVLSRQAQTVAVVGTEDLPDPPLLDEAGIRAEYLPEVIADKLHVVTDDPSLATQDHDVPPDGQSPASVIRVSEQLRRQVDELAEVEKKIAAEERSGSSVDSFNLNERLTSLRAEISDVMSAENVQVLIVVPKGLKEHIAEMDRQLAARDAEVSDLTNAPRLRIVRNGADEKSLMTYRLVTDAVAAWEKQVLKERLELAHLPDSLPAPVNPQEIDLAEKSQLEASIWSKVFPALLIIMTVTGAFYPAIDLGAGEKERGTMETLLISPAKRTEIVTGKFFTVLLFSMTTALLNLACMGLTGKHIVASTGGGAMSKLGDLAFPPATSLMWVVVLAIPMSALFSSLSLGLAMFARSSKEGQYYLTPLLTVTLGITIFCLWPTVEINAFYSVVPVLGPALLLKGLLLTPADTTLLWYAVPVLMTSVGYCALGLWWAIELFQREDILFREAEQFELGLWIRHLLRDKEPTPSFTEAGFCFVIIMLLQFVAMRVMGQSVVGLPEGSLPVRMMQLLLVQQLVIIATPALMMAVMLTTSVRRTLRLNWPSLKYLLLAAVLAPVLHPPTAELAAFLGEHFFPPLPDGIQSAMAPMLDRQQAWWLVFLTFAVAPGICEEIAFRGFILSGFSRRGRTGLAIVMSSVAFGVMHMFPQQVFNAALLGLVLGLLAVRSNSLFPSIVFHICYNGTEVLRNRLNPDVWTLPPVKWFVTVQTIDENSVIHYGWPLLAICSVVAAILIAWLIRQGTPRHRISVDSSRENRHLSAATTV